MLIELNIFSFSRGRRARYNYCKAPSMFKKISSLVISSKMKLDKL